MDKYHIQKDTVSETLVIPLYGRKLCSEKFPQLFKDEKAGEIVDKLDYDFSSKKYPDFGLVEVATRQLAMEIELKNYVSAHPNAAVVNLGCGLDMTAENNNNGKMKIYNIDLPEVIKIRNELIPPEDGVKNIAADLNKEDWLEKIDGGDGAFFFAAGVFYYFSKAEAIDIFKRISGSFNGALVFDCAGKKAVNIMNKHGIKGGGINGVEAKFYINDIKELRDVLPQVNVASKGYMLGYNDLKSVKGIYRFISKIGDKMMKMQIYKLEF